MLVKVRAVESADMPGAVIRAMHESTRVPVPGRPADRLVRSGRAAGPRCAGPRSFRLSFVKLG